jgi:lipopolysaccharide export system ATP-binding protein
MKRIDQAKSVPLMKHPFFTSVAALAWAMALALGATSAWAERADRDKPMNIESDALRYEDQKQLSTFTGRVVVTKGTIVMRGARLEVRQDTAGNQFGTMFAEPGKRAFFRQKREGVDEFIEGEGETIEYDGKADTVRFLRRAEMRRLAGATLQDQVLGSVIVYNNTTEVYTVDGAQHGRRRARRAGVRTRGAAAPGQPAAGGGGRVKVTVAEMPAVDAGLSRLAVRGLRKNYGARRVVHDVSLDVANGEVVGLLGPNGAGKTTSFYMIVGLVRADAGSITIDGRPIEHMPIHQRSRLGLSYLPQEASIFRKLTVAENVRAVLELQVGPDGRALPRAEIERRLTELLEQLHVNSLRDSPAPALSGGERRRVEIARALATQPRFILLDEPFAGIDPIAVIEIQRIIAFLKDRGIGVLITDHNVRETLGICDHAVIISEGRVLATGTPADIVDNPEVRRVYLGEHFRL